MRHQRIPHLTVRSGIHYFRKVIPRDLRNRFGRREFKLSLQTRDLLHAREHCRKLSTHFEKVVIYVGARLREARILNRLTQTDLADRLGISFQQVQKYEKGTNRIGASRLFEMTDILGVSVSFFFEGLSENRSPETKLSRLSLLIAMEIEELKPRSTRDDFLSVMKLYYE